MLIKDVEPTIVVIVCLYMVCVVCYIHVLVGCWLKVKKKTGIWTWRWRKMEITWEKRYPRLGRKLYCERNYEFLFCIMLCFDICNSALLIYTIYICRSHQSLNVYICVTIMFFQCFIITLYHKYIMQTNPKSLNLVDVYTLFRYV